MTETSVAIQMSVSICHLGAADTIAADAGGAPIANIVSWAPTDTIYPIQANKEAWRSE